ncbi:MAG: O-antigen ligase family protein [Candidatus Sulfotelmatobacter sp.]
MSSLSLVPRQQETAGAKWPVRLTSEAAELACKTSAGALHLALRPLQGMIAMPTALMLVALTAMLLRHPDVPFYEIDRVAFALLVISVVGGAFVTKRRLWIVERATWPMAGLAFLAVASVIGEPFDNRTWSLLAAKFIVPYALFHLSALVFREERQLELFESFALIVLAYLCFTSIAFMVGAKSLIFPRFILDESLGYHADRARGPLLQAVANGVSLNLLGLLAIHAILRKKIQGLKAAALLASLPLAILSTMTRAVWLSFVVSVGVLIVRSHNRRLRQVSLAVAIMGALTILITLSVDGQRRALIDRLQESGPVDFRQAVYTGGWEMFLEKPLTGWGVNQMPTELARHVSGYSEKELYPHNTYLELLVEHGVLGLALYVWLMWELLRLGRALVPREDNSGFLNRQFHAMWPVLLGVYLVNASVVVMNYQFVNGLLFVLAGMLAAQHHRTGAIKRTLRQTDANEVIGGSVVGSSPSNFL